MPGMDVKREHEEETSNEYRPRPTLTKPVTYLRDIQYLINAMDRNEIDVNPEYQREVVWTADRMSQLINSLMENYYIPPIIFSSPVSSPNVDGSNPALVCVDGKQRLSSIKAFVQGMIPCEDRYGQKWYFCGPHGRVLSAKARKEFLNKEFVTFEYTGLRPEEEVDLFGRVQMGMPLSAAEKLRASNGPWQELARCFVDDFPDIYSLQKDRMRAKDFQLTLSCFSQLLEVQQSSTPGMKATHAYLPKLLKNTGALDDDLKSHLASVWKTFQDLIELDREVFANTEKRLKAVQTFAPIEMVAVTVLISRLSEVRSNHLLVEDIRDLRDTLRENFADIRTNTAIWKAIWGFIAGIESTVKQNIQTGLRPPQPAPRPAVSKAKQETTTRTKPSAPLSAGSSDAIAMKSEPQEQEFDSVRPRKRQRTGSAAGSMSPHPTAVSSALSRPPTPATTTSSLGIPSRPTSPVSRPMHHADQPLSSDLTPVNEAPMLSPFVPMAPPTLRPAKSVRQQSAPLSVATSTTRQPQKQTPTNEHVNIPTPSISASTPGIASLVTPLEARQNRRSELDSYRAPIAPMNHALRASAPPSANSTNPIFTPIAIPKQTNNAPVPLRPVTTSPFISPVTTQTAALSPFASPVTQVPTPLVQTPQPFINSVQLPSRYWKLAARPSTQMQAPMPTPPNAFGQKKFKIRFEPSKSTDKLATVPNPKNAAPPNQLQRGTQQRKTSLPQYDGVVDLTGDEPGMADTSIPQYGGVVDLTGDEPVIADTSIPQYDGVLDGTGHEPETAEQQRLNLLSSFQKGSFART